MRPEDAFEEFAREFIRRHEGPRPLWRAQRILVPIDFSPCSRVALEHAEELARSLRAELILLHTEEFPGVGSQMNPAHATAARELGRAVQQLRDDQLEARSLLCAGWPAEEILKAATGERVSLIVMGTHGRTGVAHALMGSTAERVVRSAPCPVLTVSQRAAD